MGEVFLYEGEKKRTKILLKKMAAKMSVHLTVTSLRWAFQDVNAPVLPPVACLHRLDIGL